MRICATLGGLFLLAVAVPAPPARSAEGPAGEIHIAPGGDDAGQGTADRPLATFAAAQRLVRQRLAEIEQGEIRVVVGDGIYRQAEPLAFSPDDGGSEKLSVTYVASPRARPIVSGGQTISGFRPAADGTWVAEIPQVRSGRWTFRQLFVNGRRAVRARQPNEGFFRVEQVGDDRRTNFRYAEGDLKPYGDLHAVELVFLHDWSITRCPIRSIDPATRTLTVPVRIGGSASWAVMDWFEKQPRYFVENSRELLDAPGEWFLDEKSGRLSYMPRPGEAIDSTEFVAPVVDQILVVRGTQARPVQNLAFVGLSFEHSGWAPANRTYWGRQACTYWTTTTEASARSHEEADPAAVEFQWAERCRLAEGRIAHIGASGVWFGTGTRDNQLSGCLVTDVGGNGVMIGEGQARTIDGQPWWSAAPDEAAVGNRVDNCLVERCGQELFGAVGVWVGLAGRTRIERNEIRQLPYTGVSVGWMWWNPKERPEPRSTPCRENTVGANHIHHVMQVLSDGGGIYTLGLQPDSHIAGNLIHDVPLNLGRAESNGMFLDQGTGGFLIEKNLIYGVDRSPLRFHKGWINVVRENVLAVGPNIPAVRYNDTKEERIALENNTLLGPDDDLGATIAEALQTAGPSPRFKRVLAQLAPPAP